MPIPHHATHSTADTHARRPNRRGSICLNAARLRQLRGALMLSQRDLADEFGRRDIQVSIATLKRAETGQAVRYRIARELARYFELPASELLHADALAAAH